MGMTGFRDYLLKPEAEAGSDMQELDLGADQAEAPESDVPVDPDGMTELDFGARSPAAKRTAPPVAAPAAQPMARVDQPSAPKDDGSGDYKAQMMASLQKKSQNNAMGGLADALSNGNSFGNYFLGRMTPKNDAGKAFRDDNAIEDQRMAMPKMVNDYMRDKYATAKAGRDESESVHSLDPDSEQSKSLTEQVRSMGIKVPDGVSEAQLQKRLPLVIAKLNADAKQKALSANIDDRNERQQERMDNAIHQGTVKRVVSDPVLRQRLTQYSNLDNAYTTLLSNTITPQSLAEFQQSVRGNLGIKGGSGVGEREEAYMKSMGINGKAVKQFFTGIPEGISQDDPFVHHLESLAKTEQQNVRNQIGKRLNAASAGNGSLYARRKDLKADLDQLLSAQTDQFGSPESPKQAPAAPPLKASDVKVGDVMDGHVYKGGDPAKPESWSAQ